MKHLIQKIANSAGYKISPMIPKDMDKEFLEMYESCKEYTMTSLEKMYSLYLSINYIVDNNIEGDIVECGVWAGGSMMLAALALSKKKCENKKLYLYDTYEGMTKPTKEDKAFYDLDSDVIKRWEDNENGDINEWCYADLESVKKNMNLTGYPDDKIIYVKGKVEETIPNTMPKSISLLRLDTDWYESTKVEMKHLFPLLKEKGVLILDDYGYWKGMKKAIDEYFEDNKTVIYLSRIDQKGRVGVK